MTVATPEQVAMAKRICAEQAELDCGEMVGNGDTWLDYYNRSDAEGNASIRLALAAIIETSEAAARLVEKLYFSGGTLSSWINVNESPMGATRRHLATALRNGEHLKDIDRLAGEVAP